MERCTFFINDKFIFKEKSLLRSWSWKNENKSELISTEKFPKKKEFIESKENPTLPKDNDISWLGLVSICVVIFVGYKFFSGSSKEFKPYFCNWVDGELGTLSKPCEEGGQSRFKKYVNYKFDNENECNIYIGDLGSTDEMKRKYPTSKWMIGCDKKW